jgi:hypothetical protein
VHSLAERFDLLPMQKIVAELRRRDVDLAGMRALEVFGYTGERLTRHYAPFVKSLEIWELDPAHESTLRQNFPRAEVRIVDSYEQVRRTKSKYDFVVIDNHITPEEHFDLFPHIFTLLSESSVLMVLVAADANARVRRLHPDIFNAQHLEQRRVFYRTQHPERVPLAELALHYRTLASENGFDVDWHFFRNRRLLPVATGYYDLLLKLRLRDRDKDE